MSSSKLITMKSILAVSLCLTFVVGTNVSFLRKLPQTSKPAGRIIGGQNAQPGQYPWIAAIYITKPDGQFFCSGSVYNEQWILTAAQCVQNATQFKVQVGSNFLTSDDPNRVTVSASKSFFEPRFDISNMRHDVGLIKLDSPLTFNDYIKPVGILSYGAMNPVYDGVKVELAGWGQTSDTGDLVDQLSRVDLTILGQTNCKPYFGEQLFGSMCCTVGTNNEGPCLGDIGSPLMGQAPVGNHTNQVGIASFISANGCESTDPKGYTRTDSYFYWIVDTIKAN